MASGDSLFSFVALDFEPPDDLYPQLIFTLVASSDEPDDYVPMLAFDPSTNEYADFASVMPRNYGGGGLDVTIIWSSGTASGVVRWEVAFKSFTDDVDDLDTKTFATANSGNFTTASAAGELDYALITFTDGAQIDNIAAGEYFRMRVNRDAADAADTMNGNDAELIAIEIRES
jgi:hypothetical protein